MRDHWKPLRHALGSARRAALRLGSSVDGPISSVHEPSSVTDRSAYVDFCARAAMDERAFRSFRREPVYVGILEHVSEEQGAEYLHAIRRDNPRLLEERLDVWRSNDRWGSPILYEYPGIGRISPVTLRYLKVLSDIERLFGDLTGKRIVEIGVGYGGQARLMLEHWAVHRYALVDLEPVLRLARRYLGSSGTYPSLVSLPPAAVVPAGYDLCISNYAFSELTREAQDFYASSLVTPASRGYLTCNFISDVHGIDSWSREELSQIHPGAHWLPEEPLTFEGNAILVWGDSACEAPTSASQTPVS